MKSMKHELMAAAAAVALIAGTGGAFAQSPQAPKVEQGQAQPGGGVMEQNKDAPKKKDLDARGGSQAQQPPGSAQTPGAKTDMKTQGQAQGTPPSGAGGVQKKDSAGQMDRDGPKQAQERPGQKQDTARDAKPGDTERVQLSEQQRTRISQTIKTENRNLRRVERTQVNFTINVGAVVPRTITLYPLPAPIISVVPAYRGYLYIVVGDDLLIIHPRTYEIVAVIPA